MQRKSSRKVLECVEKENVIQAVVILDNYNHNFRPVTSSPCLMPLVNRSLLDYTLQCLSLARVQEVILFCSTDADRIKEFLGNGKWGRMTVSVVVSEGCRSLGDAMRDLDAKSLIRNDFILLTGNAIGNARLVPILERHKKSAAIDKGLAMTLIYKECGRKLKSIDNRIVVVTDAETNRVIYYNNNPFSRKIEIPLETILERSNIDIRSDLDDTGLCVCSVSVPPLFSDNFDFQTKDDFIRGLLMNDEILESNLHAYILPSSEYCASVTNWQNYHSISHDIIHRWTFPQVPDNTEDMYSFRMQNIYIEEGVSLAKECSILEDVVIGSGSKIGANACISKTVIGRNCEISDFTNLMNSHLFHNVVIEDRCTIEYSVVAHGCKIGEGSEVSHSILGPGVVVGRGEKVEGVRLQSEPSHKDTKDDGERLGEKAFIHHPRGESESDSDSEGDERKAAWSGLRIERVAEDDESPSESEGSDDGSGRESVVPEDTNLFYNEVVDSLIRGYEDKISCENLVLEINSSRYAYNVTVNEVNYHVTRAILSLKEDASSWDHLGGVVAYFVPLLKNYMRNQEAMNDCLTAIEDEAEHKSNVRLFIIKILHTLYDKDVLNEDAILRWNKSPREDFPFGIQLRKQMVPFIKWLEEADEESSEED